jgi:hypothetical protein
MFALEFVFLYIFQRRETVLPMKFALRLDLFSSSAPFNQSERGGRHVIINTPICHQANAKICHSIFRSDQYA